MPIPMLFSLPVCLVFWCQVWQPLVRERLGRCFVDEIDELLPNWPVLRMLGPLCVQRVIAQGVTARLAWLSEHRIPAYPRFADDSVWNWTEIVSRRIPRKQLRATRQRDLRHQMGVYYDGLVQVLVMPADRAAPALRLVAFVCICARLMQCYRELCRRVGYQQARAIIAEDLPRCLGPQARVPVPGVPARVALSV